MTPAEQRMQNEALTFARSKKKTIADKGPIFPYIHQSRSLFQYSWLAHLEQERQRRQSL